MTTLYTDIMENYAGRATVTLPEVASYFGLQADTLLRKTQSGEIKLPMFRMDPQSQKCAPMVWVRDFATYAQHVYDLQLEAQLRGWQAESA